MSTASARIIARSSLRQAPRLAPSANRQFLRHQSTSSSSAGGSSHIASGLAGGVAVLLGGYAAYSFSSAGKLHSGINKSMKEADKYYKEATKQFQQSTPDANEAIEYLRKTAYSYAAFVPGGRGYVDAAFKDLDAVREQHKDEVDSILKDTYTELQQIAKNGLNADSAQKSYALLETTSKRLGEKFSDAFSTILNNHPDLKDKFGGKLDQLKQMGESYGPDAKKQVDETWKQVQDIAKGGFSASNIEKVRKLIEEKVQQVQQLGDKAWSEGMEQAKPYLEKNPKVKELVEKNTDALKQGNLKALFDKVKSSVESGSTEDLEKYVTQAKDKVQKSTGVGSGGLDQLFNMIPRGGDIMSKLTQLKDVAEKHKGEGEKLLQETMDEFQKVLSDKSKKAEELAEKAKKDAQ